eukprot:scaffold35017_cov146-Isochrysis_galbana.AAC.1
MGCCCGLLTVYCARSYSVRWSWSVSEKRSSASSSSVARGDSLAWYTLRDGWGGFPSANGEELFCACVMC